MLRFSALLLAIFAGCAAPDPFLAGTAVADLTPDHPVPLAGYGARKGKPMAGVHDAVFAKALWMEREDRRICLVTTDLVGTADEFRREVLRRLPPEFRCALIIAASHNHSGPGALSRNPLVQIATGKFDAGLYETYVGRFVELVCAAARNRRPARAAASSGTAPELQRNRRARFYAGNPPLDPEIVVLKVGAAILTSYAAHGTVLGAENFLLSGDWPGAFQRALERRIGDTALYANGAEGDLSPAAPDGRDDFERCEKLGEALADRVEALVRGEGSHVERLAYIEEGVDLPKATMPFLPTKSVIGVLVVNDAAFLCVPGEMSAELGVELKRRFRARGYRHVAILGLANDHLGYFLTEEQYRKGGYERDVSFYGPKMGEFLLGAFGRIGDRLQGR